MSQPLIARSLPEGFSRIRKQLVIRVLGSAVFLIVGVLVKQSRRHPDISWTSVALPIAAIAIIALPWLLRKQKQRWENYRLILDDRAITEEMSDRDRVTILRDDIIALERMPDGGVTIRTKDTDRNIYIPPEIEFRDEILRSLAATIRASAIPAPSDQQPLLVRLVVHHRILFLLCLIVATTGLFAFTTPAVVIILGVAIIVFMTCTFVEMQSYTMMSANMKIRIGLIFSSITVVIVVWILVVLGFFQSYTAQP